MGSMLGRLRRRPRADERRSGRLEHHAPRLAHPPHARTVPRGEGKIERGRLTRRTRPPYRSVPNDPSSERSASHGRDCRDRGRRGLDRALDRRRAGRLVRDLRRRLADRRTGHRRGRSGRRGRGRPGGRGGPERVRHVGEDVGGRSREGPASGRRAGRGARPRARAGRDARQRLAPALAPELGHAARREELPLLRRPAHRARRRGLRDERLREPHRVGSFRRHGRDHAVERATDARDVADRTGARRRQQRRRQAARVGAAQRIDPRRPHARGRPARRRVQRRAGDRRGGRRRADGTSGRRPDRVHGLDRDRQARRAGRRREPHPDLARARREVAVRRVRRRRPRRRREAGGEPVRQRRPGVPGGDATDRRAFDGRRVPRTVPRGSRRDPSGRPARGDRPTSGR